MCDRHIQWQRGGGECVRVYANRSLFRAVFDVSLSLSPATVIPLFFWQICACCNLFDVPLVLVVHLLRLDEVLAGGLQLLLHLGDPGGEGGHALLHLGQLVVLLLQQVLQLHHLARLVCRLQGAVGQTLGEGGE